MTLFTGLKNRAVEKGSDLATRYGPLLEDGWGFASIWLFNILVALDQLANTLFWGDPDQTISSRAGKARVEGRCWGICLCGLLDAIDHRHCHKSLEYDEGGNAVMAQWRRRKFAAQAQEGET